MESRGFACWRYPDSEHIHYCEGAVLSLFDAPTKGFVIHPFVESINDKAVVITPDVYEIVKDLSRFSKMAEAIQTYQRPFDETPVSKESFEAYVRIIIRATKSGSLTKCVAARNSFVPKDDSPLAAFERACKKYPHAYIALFATEATGVWLCASPELLLSAKADVYKTVSLAGTKTASHAPWTEKEIEEQRVVSDFIKNRLSEAGIVEVVASKDETIQSGHLFHLQTIFTGISKEPINPLQAALQLHPTPAVGGIPRKAAFEMIEKYENNKRSYYSGFIGFFNQEECQLYVNLRCCEWVKKGIVLHAGCGVNSLSDPVKEWFETEEKMRVMKEL
jgi:isochorismate synthase